MLIMEVKKFVNTESIQAGIAMEKLNHIIVERHFTEEEMTANREFAKTASVEEHNKMINDWKNKDKCANTLILEKLRSTLGERVNSFSLIDSEFGYLRIESYRDATEAEILKVLEVLKEIDIPNRRAIVNYSTRYDDDACKAKAKEICQEYDGKFITYKGYTGRLKYNEAENFYYFMKKGARSKACYISERDICVYVKNAG